MLSDELNILYSIDLDRIIKYNGESYKVTKTATTKFGFVIYIEKIPDDGKKYNIFLISKDNRLEFHILGYISIPISYSDIELL